MELINERGTKKESLQCVTGVMTVSFFPPSQATLFCVYHYAVYVKGLLGSSQTTKQ
jgi:hypothetical protein